MPGLDTFKMQRIHDMRLAGSICVAAVVQVLSFDPKKMTVNVQPLSKQLENGKYESQPPILKVPVALTHCGGFIFRPWIKEGDIGTVVNRKISAGQVDDLYKLTSARWSTWITIWMPP